MTIDSLDIQISASAKNADKELDKLVARLDVLQKNLSGIPQKSTGFKKVSASANQLSNSLKNTNKETNNLLNGFKRLYINVRAVRAVFDGLTKSVKLSMDYLETLNYFNNAWAQVAERADLSAFEELGYASADAYVRSFSERAKSVTSELTGFTVSDTGVLEASGMPSLGLDPSKVMNYQAMFGQMASSMGMTSENSLLLSEALTKIGADLASLRNDDFEKVWSNMASGLVGNARVWDKFGTNIRNVNLQQKLFDLGINANIQNLNQNEKAMLRMIILLDSTKYAWADLSETLDSPANQLRMLKANFTNLGRTIGNLFLPLVQKVLPYINGVVIALQRFFTWIGKLIGIDLSSVTSSVGDTDFSSLVDGTESVEKGFDKATTAAKKLQASVRSFDELKVINMPDTSGTSGVGVGGIGGGASGALDDAFKKAIEEYLAEWDKAYSQIENRAEQIADKLQEAFNLENVFKGFKIGFVTDKFDDLGQKASELKNTIVDIFSNTKVVDAYSDAVTAVETSFGAILGSIASIETSALYGFITGLADGLSDSEEYAVDKISAVLNNIKQIADKVTELAQAFAKIGTAFESDSFSGIVEALVKVSTMVNLKGLEVLTGIIKDLVSAFADPAIENVELYTAALEKFFNIVENLLHPFEEAAEYEMGSGTTYEGSGIQKLIQFLSDINGEAVSVNLALIVFQLERLVALTDKLDGLGTTLKRIEEEFTIGLAQSLEETRQKFVNFGTDIANWFNNDVKPWFTKEKWAELANGIKQGVSEKWNEFITWWKTTGIYQWYEQHIKPWFSKEKWSFDGIRQGLTEGFNNAIAGAKQIWNSFANWLNQYLVWDIPDFQLGNMTFEGGRIVLGQLPTFETGGFPEDGLFMANHGELVGQFSNGKTAVANNAQIVEGIKAGVYDAVVSAMRDTRGNGGTVRVVGDSQGIFNLVREAADEYFETTGEPAFTF